MKVFRAYRTELDPTSRQQTSLCQCVGTSRWAYNWGLQRKIEGYQDAGQSPSSYELQKQLVVLKKKPQEEGGVPWICDVSARIPSEALKDLDKAYVNFFRRCKNNASRKGFPKFKKKRDGSGRFRLQGAIRVGPSWIQLPRLGRMRLKEKGYLPTEDVKVLSATVSQRAGRWFVSIQVEEEYPEPPAKIPHVVGVDVGSRKLAVTSDGEIFENPKALAKAQRRLAYLNRSVARKQKGSSNRRKAVRKLQKQHYRILNIRKDAIHKATTSIVKKASIIVIETLNVQGMMKNRRVARCVADAGMDEFHRQLEYKAKWYGAELSRADRFFPSSKTCSMCGNVKTDLGDSETYHCDSCGLTLDRDLNAAMNLRNLAASSAVTACGEDVRPARRSPNLAASVKQEPSTVLYP